MHFLACAPAVWRQGHDRGQFSPQPSSFRARPLGPALLWGLARSLKSSPRAKASSVPSGALQHKPEAPAKAFAGASGSCRGTAHGRSRPRRASVRGWTPASPDAVVERAGTATPASSPSLPMKGRKGLNRLMPVPARARMTSGKEQS